MRGKEKKQKQTNVTPRVTFTREPGERQNTRPEAQAPRPRAKSKVPGPPKMKFRVFRALFGDTFGDTPGV